jgi:fumarate hydratase subunit beta
MIFLRTPLAEEDVKKLKAGDMVSLTGRIFTARDAAHARMAEMIDNNENLPFELCGQIIYYTGPCPPKPGQVTGSAGPTTSGRMDLWTPLLLELGLKGMIGKGERSSEVIASIIKNRAVYFAVTGGAGALISKSIKESRVIAFPELGTESIKELWVEGLPCIVAIDSAGNDIYDIERKKYERGE